MNKSNTTRSQRHHKKRNTKPQTNKILDRITFNPQKHKQKVTKSLRKKTPAKKPTHSKPTPNVNNPEIWIL
jgi:hypothetical protein